MFHPKIIKLYFIWFFSLIFILYFSFSTFQHSETASDNFLNNFSNWDGKYYLSIAQNGYQNDQEYAFFPLYPLAIRVVSVVLGNFELSAILISVISSFLAILILYRLVSLELGKIIAEKTIIFLLFFPSSFFLLVTYSESLFLFLTVASFYFFKKEKYFKAALFAALVSATRPMGIAVAMAFFIQLLTSGGFNHKNWMLIFAPFGLIVYSSYLYLQTGDPLFFLASQQNWQRSLNLPWVSFGQTISNILQPGFIQEYFYVFLNLLFAIFGLGLCLRSFRFLPAIYSVYTFLSVLLPLLTSTLTSMPRFLITIFPIFILLALIKNQYVIFTYQIVSLMLLSSFAILYITGFWIS